MSSFKKHVIALLVAVACVFPVAASAADQIIFVDFKHARLLHYYGDNQSPDSYPIVLPRTTVQQQMQLVKPIHGVYQQADYQPTWWPTPSMRRNDPSLPAAVHYGEPRHPIGIYRLRIDWQNPVNPSFWEAVRIHGGAREDDLYEDKSSGCIRMRDADIKRMVEIMRQFGGEIQVTFMPPQFM